MTRLATSTLALALLVAPGLARADAGVVIVVPAITSSELVDALRVELRARGEAGEVVIAPEGALDEQAVRALVAPHAPTRIVWVDDGDDPLRPPVARLLPRAPATEAVLAAPLDAIDTRLFALGVTALLDAPIVPPPAPTVSSDTDAPPTLEPTAPAVATAPGVATASRTDAPSAPPPRPAPTGGFVVTPRLGLLGAGGSMKGVIGLLGAGGSMTPFAAGAHLSLDLQIADHVVLGVWGAATLAADMPDPALVVAAVSLGGRAFRVPGTLTVLAEGAAVFASERLAVGPGVHVRWEWPIDAFLRIGPRVAGYALWDTGSGEGFASAAPNGWMVVVGIDILGVDWRML